MRTAIRALVGLLLCLCNALPAHAQSATPAATPGADLQISILTFGPGAIYWERFGHDAILVRNTTTGTAIDYNYGIFDFSQKNFFLNFARGYMIYRMAADPLAYDLQMYQQAGRSVTAQRLNLTPAQKLKLSRFLQWNVLPENTRYRYDYFRSNCATRVRDALNMALGNALKKQLAARPAPPGHGYRYEAVRLMSPDLFLGLAMDIALGPAADRPLTQWRESFIPMILARDLNHVQVPDAQGRLRPLVASQSVLVPPRLPAAPSHPPRLLIPLLLIGLGLALLLWLLGTRRNRAARAGFAVLATLYALFCSIGGLILLAMWGFTQHWASWHNENLLLLDPLLLLLIPAWIGVARRRTIGRFARWLGLLIACLAAASLLLRLIPGCYQANLHWIALFLPIHAVLIALLWHRSAQLAANVRSTRAP